MPPQQGERLLDVFGEVGDLGAHEVSVVRVGPSRRRARGRV
jgi:hypothetical protein